MHTVAVVLDHPGHIDVRRLALHPAGPDDVVVAVRRSGISTGTERLLFEGSMPAFPGMGYPLVPGYEAFGHVVATDRSGSLPVGQPVFVPGAQCFAEARGLFGASAAQLVVPAARVLPVTEKLGENAVLLALAATAFHTFTPPARPPELVVGHGALGRLLARLVVATGAAAPTVWDTNPSRMGGSRDYVVLHPDDDPRRDYGAITDVSGDPTILERLIDRLAPSGEVVLAGFYKTPLVFAFPPAFMREARIRVAAQWQRDDLEAVARLAESGALVLDDLLTHRADAREAAGAYATAFDDPTCLKMVLDWSALQ